jgi:drug/metabolite transporter (DMT)-like permease
VNHSQPSPAQPRHHRAIFMLLLATACWGLSFPVMKALALEQQKLVPDLGSWFFTSLGVMYRFGLAGLILALFACRDLKNLTQLELEQGLGLAVFGAAGILFQMDGLSYTAASTSAFLTQCYCIFIPLWVALLSRRWPARKVVFCVGLVVLGMAVLADLDFRDLKLGRGEWETLIASLLFTGQILWLERPRYSGNNPIRFSVVMFLGMSILTLPVVLLTSPNFGAWTQAFASPAACGFLAALIVICTLGAYLLMNFWQPRVTATEAGLIYCVEPVIASTLALFLPALFSVWANLSYPNETLTTRLLIGGSLITVANVLLQKR